MAPANQPQPLHTPIGDYEARVLAYERRPDPRLRPGRGPRKRRPAKGRLLLRRAVALVLVALFLSALASYITTMLKPSNVGLAIRSVEWVRDHGGAWLVSDLERAYYSNQGPTPGGSLRSLPAVGAGAVPRYAAAGAPPAIPPVIRPALPGEGVWRPTGPPVAGGPPALVTTFRPDAVYRTVVAGVAWIDRTRTNLTLYPGRYQPPVRGLRGPMEVPTVQRARLVATFNSGFKLQDSGGGFAALGHVDAPLRSGLATIVGFRDGNVDVRAWTGATAPGPEVAFARQNLRLIVDGGQLNPNLSDGPAWGVTVGNSTRVWRSGIGVDARGNLLYAAADGQTVTGLARILQRAGAIRAMQLDINYEWVSFNFYEQFGAGAPAKLLPGMNRPATRYLSPDDRDFFAVTAR